MNTKKIKFLKFVIQVKIISELGEKKHFFGTQKKQIQQSNADIVFHYILIFSLITAIFSPRC